MSEVTIILHLTRGQFGTVRLSVCITDQPLENHLLSISDVAIISEIRSEAIHMRTNPWWRYGSPCSTAAFPARIACKEHAHRQKEYGTVDCRRGCAVSHCLCFFSTVRCVRLHCRALNSAPSRRNPSRFLSSILVNPITQLGKTAAACGKVLLRVVL